MRLDYSGVLKSVTNQEIDDFGPEVLKAAEVLKTKTGEGKEFLGWLDLPVDYDSKDEYHRIKKAAKKIQKDSDVFVIVGIGGSYMGPRAVLEALEDTFHNIKDLRKKNVPQIIYVGNSLSQKYIYDLMGYLEDKDFSINVISKSGTTTELSVAFRIFRKLLIQKYGSGAKERIFATTDKEKGPLKELADREGYETFVVPDDIGGRYSVLSAVGLLPLAVGGIDLDSLMQGALDARADAMNNPYEVNDALKYAAIRNLLYRKGKKIELFSSYEPCLHYLLEWWKQLFGESEGKNGKGIFPVDAEFTTDLHSMGQYIQDGERSLFETVLRVQRVSNPVLIPPETEDIGEIDYLVGRSVQFINDAALSGATQAHVAGGVPAMTFTISNLDAYNLGHFFFTFEYACGVSGYLLGVNPFNQPGVEAYKRNMFAILGKPY